MKSLDYYARARRIAHKATSDFCEGIISARKYANKMKIHLKIEEERLKDVFEEIKQLLNKKRSNYNLKQLSYQF